MKKATEFATLRRVVTLCNGTDLDGTPSFPTRLADPIVGFAASDQVQLRT